MLERSILQIPIKCQDCLFQLSWCQMGRSTMASPCVNTKACKVWKFILWAVAWLHLWNTQNTCRAGSSPGGQRRVAQRQSGNHPPEFRRKAGVPRLGRSGRSTCLYFGFRTQRVAPELNWTKKLKLSTGRDGPFLTPLWNKANLLDEERVHKHQYKCLFSFSSVQCFFSCYCDYLKMVTVWPCFFFSLETILISKLCLTSEFALCFEHWSSFLNFC